MKHADASNVMVTLAESTAYVELTISDDGRGISASKADPSFADTLGLTAMRERAQRLGGQLSILPREQGTTIRAVIPLMNIGESEEGE